MSEFENAPGLAQRFGPWALVAGGSEGIGEHFARQLARDGLNIAMIARRAAPLELLAESLRRDYAVEVRTAVLDLASDDVLARTREATEDLDVGLFIYNAGATVGYNEFVDWSEADLRHMLRLNGDSPVMLAQHFARRMVSRGRGGLVFLSSMAEFGGCARMAIYPAGKSFLHMLAEGLWRELKPRGIDVLCLCAGATRTPSHADVDFAAMGGDLADGGAMAPAAVAAEGLAQLGMVPFWAAGAHNRARLPPGYIENRPRVIEWGTAACAAINGLEYSPLSSPDG